MLFSSYWNINNKILYLINGYNIQSVYEEKSRQMATIFNKTDY